MSLSWDAKFYRVINNGTLYKTKNLIICLLIVITPNKAYPTYHNGIVAKALTT